MSQEMKAFSGSPMQHESPTECNAVHCRRSSHTLRRTTRAWGDYEIRLYDPAGGTALAEDWERFLAQPAIMAEKKTKHKCQEVDLRPHITQLSREIEDGCFTVTLRLPAGAALNLNPSLVLGALWQYRGSEAEYPRIARTAILRADLTPFT